MRTRALILILLIALVGTAASAQSTTGTDEPQHLCADLGFADFLMDQGEYERALVEYLRYGFLENRLEDPNLRLRLGRTRLRLHQFEAALKEFSLESTGELTASLADSLAFGIEASRIWLNLDPGDRPRPQRSSHRHLPPLEYRTRMLAVLNQCLTRNWDEARALLESASTDRNSSATEHLAGTIEAADNLPRKSPTLAGVLSALVPSSGKLYVGRKSDAIVSLVLLGSSGWISYRGFRDDGIDSIKGWSFAGISSIFYLGNIYGSVGAAQNYNRSARADLDQQLRLAIGYWTRF